MPLNKEGPRQAQLASAALSSMPMDVVGSSHLDRAIGTGRDTTQGLLPMLVLHLHDIHPRSERFCPEIG